MEIRVEWDDMAREYVAEVVDYEGRGPTGTGSNKPDALFDLVQNLKGDDKARPFAVDAFGDQQAAYERFRVYSLLKEIGCSEEDANAKADREESAFRNGFAYAVELLA